MSISRVVSTALAAGLAAIALGACGQRGALYIPGKPGDPYFDRQNRGATPTSGTTRDSTKPANTSGQPAPPAPPKREDDGNN